MIVVKTKAELDAMREAGRISRKALEIGGEAIQPGITTKEIDSIIHKYILSENATPSFLGYGGFPASACISINEEVIHGIPGNRVVKDGDIVSIDVGAFYEGYHGDNAHTFCCGTVSPDTLKLLEVTQKCLEVGISAAVIGNRIGDISNAIQLLAESHGYGVVKEFVGHGIGKEMHESPQIPNYGRAGRGPRLVAGMTLAIEPMINAGSPGVIVLDDEWTVITTDGSMSAHFENTVAVTEDGPVILTAL